YGPDNTYLGTFELSAQNEDGVPAMLNEALEQFDRIYTAALVSGKLQPDPTLRVEQIDLSPTVKALLEAARRAETGLAGAAGATGATPNAAASDAPQVLYSHVVQFVTPDAAAVDALLGVVRSTPGV